MPDGHERARGDGPERDRRVDEIESIDGTIEEDVEDEHVEVGPFAEQVQRLLAPRGCDDLDETVRASCYRVADRGIVIDDERAHFFSVSAE